MNKKWDEIKERLSRLSLPQESIGPLPFLSPDEWHIKRCKKQEILVVAETIPQHENSICLVIDLRGNVYRAKRPTYEIYQYCANSLEQFLLITERYLSIYREGRIEDCEKCEKEFRDFIWTVDSTALVDERSMWSVYAEEMGYGF